MIFKDFVTNAALLLALSILYNFLIRRWKAGALTGRILGGILFGGVAVAGMMNPFHYAPGVIFDGRSMLLSMAGLFGGPLTAAISAAIAATYRFGLGGAGAVTGAGVIVTSAALGVAYHYIRRNRPDAIKSLYMFGFGVIVHIAMLLWMLTLPWPLAFEVLRKISLPVMLIFPLGSLVLGQLLAGEEDRIHANAALKESEERFRTLFQSAPDAFYLNDLSGNFIDGNRSAEKLLGYKKEDLIGRNLLELDLLPSGQISKAAELLAQNSQGLATGPDELTLNRKDGDQVEVEISTVPVRIKGENIVLGTVRDLTERKTLEAQFRQSQKMEAIGKLAGGVAHDFNNILSVIIGNADLMAMDLEENSRFKGNVETISKEGQRAASLTRQLLAFSRKQILEPRVLNFNDIIPDMDKLLRRLIGEDIDLNTILASNLGPVEADQGQIEQVLMNLAVNARDAMPRGGKLTIETANVELDESYARKHVAVTPGPYVMMAITDTGKGLDEETRSRIFEPFFTTKGEGTGLGLSTAYGIVKQSNGNIWVYSEPGAGTTFKIYLPRVEKAAEGSEEKKISVESLTGSESVLVVEDSEQVCNLTRSILERYGYSVLTARDGEEAIELSAEHEGAIHLMITDVVMPGMSGRDLAERLNTLRPDMKVLFMSGYTDNAIVHHGVLDKEIDFLQKPFTSETMACKVREVLDG